MNDTNQTVSESEIAECQFHNNCGGWCETLRELEHNLCEHCLETHDEEMEQPAEQHQGAPIILTAVATLVDDGDGGLEANWLLEGGTAELFAGMTLLVAENAPDLCSKDGSTEVYTHAHPGEVERLRAGNEQLCQVIKHSDANILRQSQRIDNLRREVAELHAQATQRNSLLRECFIAMLKGGYSKPLRERIKASLSANTEPSLPQYHRQPLGMDEAVRARLTLIAREAAISSAHRYNYMPTTPEDAQGWQPHAWVLEALRMVELGAPVERDEHEAFSQACRDAALAKGHELDPQALNRRPNGSHTNELVECGWWGWQARAALEGKL